MVVKPLPNNSTSKNSSGGSGGPLILLHLATPEWYRMMPWKFLQLFWTGFSLRRHVVIPEWSISIEYIWIWISIQQTCLNTFIIFDNLCKSLYTSPTKVLEPESFSNALFWLWKVVSQPPWHKRRYQELHDHKVSQDHLDHLSWESRSVDEFGGKTASPCWISDMNYVSCDGLLRNQCTLSSQAPAVIIVQYDIKESQAYPNDPACLTDNSFPPAGERRIWHRTKVSKRLLFASSCNS